MTILGERAVVLGASMAGLHAARVLSDYFASVIVVERDELPHCPMQRRGVPQGQHIHALLRGGSQVMAQLYPGLLDELSAAGATVLDEGDLSKASFIFGGHELDRSGRHGDPESAKQYIATRPFLEHHVRRRIRAISTVTIMDGYDVVGLSSAHCDRVTGARVAARDGGTECHLDADLVVDATGRGSRTPRLIEDLGYRRPGEDELAVPVSYSSQLMRVPPGTLAEKLILIGALPDRPTGGGLLRCEHDTWLVTVAGMLDHQPPMDRSGMIQFAEDFAPPPMLAAMRVGEPIGSPARYRYHGSRWRRYDRMRRFPDGLIVLGDALCSFNPVYGQGMSIAAVEAKCLRDCLATGTSNLARRFFAETAKPIRAAWQLALANDLSLQGTPHSAPWSMRLMQRYTDRLLGAAEYDTVVAERFLAVMNLTASPASLLRPSVVGRVSRRRQVTNAANAAAER